MLFNKFKSVVIELITRKKWGTEFWENYNFREAILSDTLSWFNALVSILLVLLEKIFDSVGYMSRMGVTDNEQSISFFRQLTIYIRRFSFLILLLVHNTKIVGLNVFSVKVLWVRFGIYLYTQVTKIICPW
jgi:hypothetical protein